MQLHETHVENIHIQVLSILYHNTAHDKLTPEDAIIVLEELLDAQTESFKLGVILRLPIAEVERIHSTYSNCRSQLLHVIISFLKQEQPRPTWKVIVDALRSPAVQLLKLAMEVETSHCSRPETLDKEPTAATGETFFV